jgi:mercuric ion transport protein
MYRMSYSHGRSQKVEGFTLAGAIVAVLASTLCCVVPFALVSIGITGPWLARLAIFEPYRIPLDLASMVALGTAWGVHLLRVRSCSPEQGCALPGRLRATRIGLAIATVLIVVLVGAPYAIAYFGGIEL